MPFDLGSSREIKFGIYNFNTASAGGFVDVKLVRFVSSNKKLQVLGGSRCRRYAGNKYGSIASGGDAAINLEYRSSYSGV